MPRQCRVDWSMAVGTAASGCCGWIRHSLLASCKSSSHTAQHLRVCQDQHTFLASAADLKVSCGLMRHPLPVLPRSCIVGTA